MSDIRVLLEIPVEPAILVLEGEPSNAGNATFGWTEARLTVRTVRGKKMRTTQSLFDEMAAALQFPYYFGGNWPAFDECLSDMEWLLPTSGIVIMIRDAVEVLADDSDEALAALVRTFAAATATYGQPIDLGEWWDRSALPFHVVLQATATARRHLAQRWGAAGAQLIPIRPG